MNGIIKKHFFLYRFLLILLLSLSAFGQTTSFNTSQEVQFLSRRLTTKNGLPQDTIHAVTQDKSGYIWIGTDNGLVRFDGVKTHLFNHLNTPNLKNNSISVLLAPDDGSLWIGTAGGGITRYKDGKFQCYSTSSGLSSHFISAITEDHLKQVWVGTVGGGIARFREGRFISFATKNALPDSTINALCPGRGGCLWVGTSKGLSRLEKEKCTLFTTADGIADNFVTALYEDSRGVLWVGTMDGLSALENSNRITFRTKQGLSGNMITSVCEDRRGHLWVATDTGLSRLIVTRRFPSTDTRVESFSAANSPLNHFSRKSLTRVFQDREGNLWIGSSGAGLTSLHPRRLAAVTEENGLSRNHVTCLYQDKTPTMWVGTHGGGLNRINGTNFRAYTTADGLPGNIINTVLSRENNTLWVGTSRGLALFKDNTFTPYTHSKGFPVEGVRVLFEDHAQALWIGTYGGGLIHLKDNGNPNANNTPVTIYTTQQGLSNNYVLSIAEDKNQVLWIGTNKGLNRFHNGTFQTFFKEEKEDRTKNSARNNTRNNTEDNAEENTEDNEKGNAEDNGNDYGNDNGKDNGKDRKRTRFPRLSNETIFDIYPDDDGVLWIATNGGGLNRFYQGYFTHYTTQCGLYGDTIYRIIEDQKGNLWFSSNKGIFTVSLRQLNQMARGTLSYLSCRYFGEEDGMPGTVCTGGFQPAGTKTPNGELWFPTTSGIVRMGLGDGPKNTIEPPVIIEDLKADFNSVDLTQPSQLPVGTQKVEIYFTALSFTAPRKVKFRYRLKGYSENHPDDWQMTLSRGPAVYHDLPPGLYIFQVTACNNDGLWNRDPAQLEFSIAPSFLDTIWSYLLAALMLASVGIGLYWAAERRKRIEEDDERYQASNLSKPRARMYTRKLVTYMKEEKPYLDPNISAAALAEALDIPLKHLSQVINQQLNRNFKHFVNEYRIQEAKIRLLDPREQDFVLLKIALDVGFNSKSAFNAAFKKFTGTSPSQYRKKAADDAHKNKKKK